MVSQIFPVLETEVLRSFVYEFEFCECGLDVFEGIGKFFSFLREGEFC